MPVQRLFHRFKEQVGQVILCSIEHDTFRVKKVDQRRQPDAQIGPGECERPVRTFVALLRLHEEVRFSGFTTFLFRQFFLGFPHELEEAGRVDGLGYRGVFWRIVVPNSKGITAALGVIAFIASWNAFLWPLVIGQDQSAWTVQVVLSNFLNAQVLNLHELFIGAAMAILPLVIIFFFLQRYIAEGFKQSGLKG